MPLMRIFLLVSVLIPIRAEIVSGTCPTVSGTKFNCSQVRHNFYEILPFEHHKLLIYGMIPSSNNTNALDFFAFNFSNSISEYYMNLYCGLQSNENYIRIICGVKFSTVFHTTP